MLAQIQDQAKAMDAKLAAAEQQQQAEDAAKTAAEQAAKAPATLGRSHSTTAKPR